MATDPDLCEVCEWKHYPDVYPAWRQHLAFASLVIYGLLLGIGLPLFWMRRGSRYIQVRQPQLTSIMAAGTVFSLNIPLRELLGDGSMPCVSFLVCSYTFIWLFGFSLVLRFLRIQVLHELQNRVRGLMDSKLELPGYETQQHTHRRPDGMHGHGHSHYSTHHEHHSSPPGDLSPIQEAGTAPEQHSARDQHRTHSVPEQDAGPVDSTTAAVAGVTARSYSQGRHTARVGPVPDHVQSSARAATGLATRSSGEGEAPPMRIRSILSDVGEDASTPSPVGAGHHSQISEMQRDAVVTASSVAPTGSQVALHKRPPAQSLAGSGEDHGIKVTEGSPKEDPLQAELSKASSVPQWGGASGPASVAVTVAKDGAGQPLTPPVLTPTESTRRLDGSPKDIAPESGHVSLPSLLSHRVLSKAQLHTQRGQAFWLLGMGVMVLVFLLIRFAAFNDVVHMRNVKDFSTLRVHWGCQYNSYDYTFFLVFSGIFLAVMANVARRTWDMPDDFGMQTEIMRIVALSVLLLPLFFIGKAKNEWHRTVINSDYAVFLMELAYLVISLWMPAIVSFQPQWAPPRLSPALTSGADQASIDDVPSTGGVTGIQGPYGGSVMDMGQGGSAAGMHAGSSSPQSNGSSLPGSLIGMWRKIRPAFGAAQVVPGGYPPSVGAGPGTGKPGAYGGSRSFFGSAGTGLGWAGRPSSMSGVTAAGLGPVSPGSDGRLAGGTHASRSAWPQASQHHGQSTPRLISAPVVPLGAVGGGHGSYGESNSIVFAEALRELPPGAGAAAVAAATSPLLTPGTGMPGSVRGAQTAWVPRSAIDPTVLLGVALADGGPPVPRNIRTVPAIAVAVKPPSALTSMDIQIVAYQLIYTSNGRAHFASVLQREFSLENLLFLLDALTYRRYLHGHMRRLVAKRQAKEKKEQEAAQYAVAVATRNGSHAVTTDSEHKGQHNSDSKAMSHDRATSTEALGALPAHARREHPVLRFVDSGSLMYSEVAGISPPRSDAGHTHGSVLSHINGSPDAIMPSGSPMSQAGQDNTTQAGAGGEASMSSGSPTHERTPVSVPAERTVTVHGSLEYTGMMAAGHSGQALAGRPMAGHGQGRHAGRTPTGERTGDVTPISTAAGAVVSHTATAQTGSAIDGAVGAGSAAGLGPGMAGGIATDVIVVSPDGSMEYSVARLAGKMGSPGASVPAAGSACSAGSAGSGSMPGAVGSPGGHDGVTTVGLVAYNMSPGQQQPQQQAQDSVLPSNLVQSPSPGMSTLLSASSPAGFSSGFQAHFQAGLHSAGGVVQGHHQHLQGQAFSGALADVPAPLQLHVQRLQEDSHVHVPTHEHDHAMLPGRASGVPSRRTTPSPGAQAHGLSAWLPLPSALRRSLSRQDEHKEDTLHDHSDSKHGDSRHGDSKHDDSAHSAHGHAGGSSAHDLTSRPSGGTVTSMVQAMRNSIGLVPAILRGNSKDSASSPKSGHASSKEPSVSRVGTGMTAALVQARDGQQHGREDATVAVVPEYVEAQLPERVKSAAMRYARRLSARYIEPRAELCVNLPSKTAQKVMAGVAAGLPTLTLFYEAEREIFSLLSRGPVSRFVMSPAFLAWQRQVVEDDRAAGEGSGDGSTSSADRSASGAGPSSAAPVTATGHHTASVMESLPNTPAPAQDKDAPATITVQKLKPTASAHGLHPQLHGQGHANGHGWW